MKVFIMSLLLSTSAFATNLDVQGIINNYQDTMTDNYVESIEYRSWSLNTIRIRTVFELRIDIPLIAKFKINPEVELYFSK